MNHNEFLTINEVCDILRVSRQCLYNWRKAGIAPPVVKIGRARVLVRRQDLDSYLDARAA